MSIKKKIPEIRFKEFSEEWEKYPLATFISSLDAGVSVNSGDRTANENEFGILKTSCVSNGFFEPTENKVVFKSEEINRLREPVLENTIIISRMNTPALVGANAYISKGYAKYFLPDRLWAAKPTSIGNLRFIAYILGSDKGRLALSDLATGTSGSMKNISKPAVLRLEFRAPEVKEQVQISSYLQKLDSLINQHQQKHDKLNRIKKSMLEKMFPKKGKNIPEIRFEGFSGQWKAIKFKQIAKISRGLTYKPSDIVEAGVIVLRSSNINIDKFELRKDDVQVDKNVVNIDFIKNGDILITSANGSSQLVGKHAVINSLNIDSVHGGFMLAAKTNDPYFLNASMNTYWYSHFLSMNISGGNGAIGNIKGSDLEEEQLYVPKKDERDKIGTYFQKLDILINQHQEQITKLNNIKQALLSKMFV